MKIGLDLDDTIINTKDKMRIYWKEYYNLYPNIEYSEDLPYNVNFFGYDYIEEFWNLYREEMFFADVKKNAPAIINRLQREGHYLGLITSRPKEKYYNLVPRLITLLSNNNIHLDEINTSIKDKSIFMKNGNYDLLIDDSIVQVRKTLEVGKKAILFNKYDKKDIRHTTSWNYLYQIIKEYQ